MAILALTVGAATFDKPEEYSRSGEHYTSLAPRASDHIDDPEWLFDLGWAYREAGMQADAKRYLMRALELKPKMAFLNARVGDLYLSLGDEDSAVYYYEAALNNHYDYIEVWENLVSIRPVYYANLGLLYSEKAESSGDSDLISKANEYLKRYLEDFPDGEFSDQCRAAISRLELEQRQSQSRQNLQSELHSAQAEQARIQADRKTQLEAFRNDKPYIIGIGFYSIGINEDKDFIVKNPDSVIDDTLSLKNYATSLNEFGASFGYQINSLMLRAGFRYGTNSSGKNYFLRNPVPDDTTWNIDSDTGDTLGIESIAIHTKDDVRPKVSSVNTWRVTASADYNFYYRDPVLLFLGAQAGVGGARLNDSPYDNFESISFAGAGIGGGVMFRFADFLFEFAYRQNIAGNSAGGTIVVGGLYKF